jgi:hypothetical protein
MQDSRLTLYTGLVLNEVRASCEMSRESSLIVICGHLDKPGRVVYDVCA